MDKFKWIDFYTKFATILLSYKNNRSELIKKIQNVYKTINMNLPKLESNGIPKDIDPFTVFGMFNKGIRDDTRKKIIGGLIKEFNVNAEIPNFFAGIPTLNNLMATFYAFEDGNKNRKTYDIDNLWDLFETAIELSNDDNIKKRQNFSLAYNKVLTQYAIKWNITMALFWIRPNTYINLDSRNRWFIGNSNNISNDIAIEISKLKEVPQANKYLEIRDKCLKELSTGNYKYKTFPELSYYAWIESEEENKRQKENISNDIIDELNFPIHYWLFSPGENASQWDNFQENGIMGIGWKELGDLHKYNSKDEILSELSKTRGENQVPRNNANTVWQFINDIHKGDIIFAKRGRSEIIGKGIVESNYEYNKNLNSDYPNIRKVKWVSNKSFKYDNNFAMKTLTDVTAYSDFVSKILSSFDDIHENNLPVTSEYQDYTPGDFLNEVFIDREKYKILVGLLENKKNIILQGAPGVGKTFAAKRLAYSIIGKKDDNKIEFVQFHQNYSYEDFIMGYKPLENTFKLKYGIFYNFCKKAEKEPENKYFFIIDEINRGNLSKIFGELLMLIEKEHRAESITLAYDGKLFSVPQNLYIIGMMNTADRSLAMIDYALRRRFSFFEMQPAFDSEGFKSYQESLENNIFDKLIYKIKDLNNEIKNDSSLGKGFCIGHSYFCDRTKENCTDEWMKSVVDYDILTMLSEYWFDNEDKVNKWADILHGVFQ